jgi:hypothetical protein
LSLEPDLSEPSRKLPPFRWLTLAEAVGVLALVVAALGYWDTHRERVAAAKAHEAEAEASVRRQAFLMTASPQGDGAWLKLEAVTEGQVIQTQAIWFPKALREAKVETTGNPRLEAGWIAGPLRKMSPKAETGRVPVAIQTVFVEDGQMKTDRALYQLGDSLHPRLLRGAEIKLEGLSLVRRGLKGEPQAAADSLWPKT